MYTANETLYLKNGKATEDGDKTDPVYLVAGACISDTEAIRVGLKETPVETEKPSRSEAVRRASMGAALLVPNVAPPNVPTK